MQRLHGLCNVLFGSFVKKSKVVKKLGCFHVCSLNLTSVVDLPENFGLFGQLLGDIAAREHGLEGAPHHLHLDPPVHDVRCVAERLEQLLCLLSERCHGLRRKFHVNLVLPHSLGRVACLLALSFSSLHDERRFLVPIFKEKRAVFESKDVCAAVIVCETSEENAHVFCGS